MTSIDSIVATINEGALGESIQELIKDLKATQHGDRTNPFYDILSDYHMEGGVWKHTLFAIEGLPELAKALGPEYENLYNEYVHSLRAAALYHDIGKITTQKPSAKRPGSFSFPRHAEQDVVQGVFDQYGIEPSELVLDLVSHHHVSPKELAALQDEWDDDEIKLLILLKAADNLAVGPRSVQSATTHVQPFIDVLGEVDDPLDPSEWGADEFEWDDETVFEPELGEEEPKEAYLNITVSSSLYQGKSFQRDMWFELKKNPDLLDRIEAFVRDNVEQWLVDDPRVPEEHDVTVDVKNSFEGEPHRGRGALFTISANVSWE